MYLPDDNALKIEVLKEAYESNFTVHPWSANMYMDLIFFLLLVAEYEEKKVVEYVTKCVVCQEVKVEHQKLAGLLQPLLIFEWKWEDITMDFILGLPKVKNMKWCYLGHCWLTYLE